MGASLDGHFSALLERRANKSWTPVLFACAEVAATYPVVAGYEVQVDATVRPHTIELRSTVGDLMAEYEGAMSAKACAPDRFPEAFQEDFANGIGHWGSSGASQVAAGIFSSSTWSYDTNHLAADGGPGMLHLLAFADYQYWNYQKANGLWVTSDFTNAQVDIRARGVNFNPNGSVFIIWVQARHPHRAAKFVNWGYIAEPRTDQLVSGQWEDISWRLEPDPDKWVWGKGANGGSYDVFATLQKSLRNVYNVHFVMLGPDNVGHPAGSFELDSCSIVFNRNGPPIA